MNLSKACEYILSLPFKNFHAPMHGVLDHTYPNSLEDVDNGVRFFCISPEDYGLDYVHLDDYEFIYEDKNQNEYYFDFTTDTRSPELYGIFKLISEV